MIIITTTLIVITLISLSTSFGRGEDTLGDHRRAQIYKFEFFELILLLKLHTCHILPPSEIDLGLFWADLTGSEGQHLFHRIG